MRYKIFADYCHRLENTSSYLDKNSIISELLRNTPSEKIDIIVPLLLGRIFPAYVSQETGVGLQQLKKSVGKSFGYSMKEIEKLMREVGDLGEVAEILSRDRKQMTLSTGGDLTVEKVFQKLRELPEIQGEGSLDGKISNISELLTIATPVEAKFLVRTVLSDLRIGVAEGRIRDSISDAFSVPPDLVERAYMMTTDYGKVAKAASMEREKGLSELGLTVGHPVNPMLAQRTDSIEEVMKRMNGKAAFEIKLDGIRIQPHKKGREILFFTRRMENYTNMFPDLIKSFREAVQVDKAIFDGELVAIDRNNGKPMSFQEVLRRRRKYNIDKVSEEIPVHIYLFDVLQSGDKMMLEKNYLERRRELEKIVVCGDRVKIVENRILEDQKSVEEFRNEAISKGQEGLLAKKLDSKYRAGRREFAWLKLKAEVETLDLVVVGAFAGRGDRAGTYGSYLLAAWDAKEEILKTVTRVGSGFTDEELETLTGKFKKIRLDKKPSNVKSEIEPDYWFRPYVIFEINYEEIQKSPDETHTSGYGLRFPRYVRLRENIDIRVADSIEEIERLFKSQDKGV